MTKCKPGGDYPLTQVAAALRKTTEFLAGELARPGTLQPDWTDFEWRIARAASAMQGISPLLHTTTRWQGPADWRLFLRRQWDHSVARHAQIIRVLESLDSAARSDGRKFVMLKGAALHARAIYPAGARPMGDIDLLTMDGDTTLSARMLATCGYETAFELRRHRVFQPMRRAPPSSDRIGEHIDNPVKIEVHARIAEQLPVSSEDITRTITYATARPGLNDYPSAASLMAHLLLHAAGNMRARALRLIQLHDIAMLAPRLAACDWEHLASMRNVRGPLWWAWPPAALTKRYYPGSIPSEILAQMREGCPRLLERRTARQQLTDVSWSNIRIEAFPGVEWARSPAEAGRYMRGRIWPSRNARLELKEGAAQIPNGASVPWYSLPHGLRILRWLMSKPPRVQTLLSVRAALATAE